MAEKKAENRFQVFFDKNDPVQEKAVEILSVMPKGEIKRYIAEAVMVRMMARVTLADLIQMKQDFISLPSKRLVGDTVGGGASD